MKTALIVFSSIYGYQPIAILFDTHQACHAVQESLERLTVIGARYTVQQIYWAGHPGTHYFISCIDFCYQGKDLQLIGARCL